ncbi:hypothetical protein AB6805_13735 [Chitinophaga sp. RCC_12]|uniref:hypothetical protein n=1 Tax=Chitinophaga sp. RCC_12 TaxID=3239226 RepID=UPI003524C45C
MTHKLITSREGLEYLERSKKPLQDFSRRLQIPSGYGTIYELPNEQILLFNPSSGSEYPGFIFYGYSPFKECCDADFFPIPEKDMTWLEAHARQMLSYLKNDSFYLNPLSEKLGISIPIKTENECEAAYDKLVKYSSSPKKSGPDKIEIAHCYSLAVTKFLIEEKNFKWELRRMYQVYNPYYYPVVSNEEKKNVDVVSKLSIAVGKRNKIPFRDFYWYITGLSINTKIE